MTFLHLSIRATICMFLYLFDRWLAVCCCGLTNSIGGNEIRNEIQRQQKKIEKNISI